MRIGLLSDTHDNVENVRAAADIFRREGISRLLHCGDVCGPTVVDALKGFAVTFVQGNMDRLPPLQLAVEQLQGSRRLARVHRLVVNGFTAVLLHGDDEAYLNQLIACGEFAYVFHGHTHRQADRRVGPTRVINPGALGGTRYEPRSIAICDPAAGRVDFIRVS
ncbi:MAG: YfcE family phosphodiesterase [Anaerolineae bacterium]